jgi:hypothetical protein
VDFGEIKKVARALCKNLNELFLCPARSDVLSITREGARRGDGGKEEGGVLRIRCEDGAEFTFPYGDAAMLPIKHSTVRTCTHVFAQWLPAFVHTPRGAATAHHPRNTPLVEPRRWPRGH